MIEAIREISKSLLPVDEWSSIDARLDVELLTQEMKHGLCDFTNLSDWLGSLLRRFCSPARDHLIDEMTSAIQFGVLNAQPRSTANGLMSIFDILQTMKLVTSIPISI